jgi:hypothetical protein
MCATQGSSRTPTRSSSSWAPTRHRSAPEKALTKSPLICWTDARTPEVSAYTRAFSDTAATRTRELRERDPLPEPDRRPGAPHPDPFLADRGWHMNQHGIYIRRAEPEPQVPPERELEAEL